MSKPLTWAAIGYVLGLCLALSACSLVGEPDAEAHLRIRTHQTQYQMGREDTIRVSIRNVGDRPVYYSTCLSASAVPATVLSPNPSIGFPVCMCLCPATLAPGDTVASSVANVRVDAFQEVRTDGSYFLQYAFYRSPKREVLLPRSTRRSNPFVVVRADG